MAKIVLKKPGRTFEILKNNVSENPMQNVPDLIKFYHTGKGICLGNNVKGLAYLDLHAVNESFFVSTGDFKTTVP